MFAKIWITCLCFMLLAWPTLGQDQEDSTDQTTPAKGVTGADIIEGLSNVIVDRAEAEAVMVFMERIQAYFSGDNNPVTVRLFPNTSKLVNQSNPVSLQQLGKLWREAFDQDLKELPSNLFKGDVITTLWLNPSEAKRKQYQQKLKQLTDQELLLLLSKHQFRLRTIYLTMKPTFTEEEWKKTRFQWINFVKYMISPNATNKKVLTDLGIRDDQIESIQSIYNKLQQDGKMLAGCPARTSFIPNCAYLTQVRSALDNFLVAGQYKKIQPVDWTYYGKDTLPRWVSLELEAGDLLLDLGVEKYSEQWDRIQTSRDVIVFLAPFVSSIANDFGLHRNPMLSLAHLEQSLEQIDTITQKRETFQHFEQAVQWVSFLGRSFLTPEERQTYFVTDYCPRNLESTAGYNEKAIQQFVECVWKRLHGKPPTKLEQAKLATFQKKISKLSQIFHAFRELEEKRQKLITELDAQKVDDTSLNLALFNNLVEVFEQTISLISDGKQEDQDLEKVETVVSTFKDIVEFHKFAKTRQSEKVLHISLKYLQDMSGGQELPQGFLKISTLAVNVSSARNAEEISQAFQKAAAPVTSYRVKRIPGASKFALQAYLGAHYSYERLNTSEVNNLDSGKVAGLFAPVGLEYSRGMDWWIFRSVGLFVPLLDLGPISRTRLAEKNVSVDGEEHTVEQADLEFENLFSPGLYFTTGIFKNFPTTLGIGGQYSSKLQNLVKEGETTMNDEGEAVTTQENEIDSQSLRWGVFLAIDMPLFLL